MSKVYSQISSMAFSI